MAAMHLRPPWQSSLRADAGSQGHRVGQAQPPPPLHAVRLTSLARGGRRLRHREVDHRPRRVRKLPGNALRSGLSPLPRSTFHGRSLRVSNKPSNAFLTSSFPQSSDGSGSTSTRAGSKKRSRRRGRQASGVDGGPPNSRSGWSSVRRFCTTRRLGGWWRYWGWHCPRLVETGKRAF